MESFSIGTGASIYSQKLLPSILSAEYEIILVTCFWAPSKTLSALSKTLAELAERRKLQQSSQVLRLRICFSSRSLVQKIFHTSSHNGYVYPSSTWSTLLGLPSPDTLIAGNIDLRVKSLFFLPFSVMHPKFLIVDRQRAFAPSCNVSWEPWLEGCLELTRSPSAPSPDSIDGLLEFYRQVWEEPLNLDEPLPASMGTSRIGIETNDEALIRSPADTTVKLSDIGVPAAAIQWLPSWHQRNPGFCIFPWQTPKAPDTPLNRAVLQRFEASTREIFMQTPNLTAPPVLSAILDALARGVDVYIVTGRGMMVWEQVLTAFTTTARCIKRLTKNYLRLCATAENRQRLLPHPASADAVDLEAQSVVPGALTIAYFKPAAGSIMEEEEPVHSHLKLTIFDSRYTVLGSGNMDRASWFTSQELGILIDDVRFAQTIKDAVDTALQDRLDSIFPMP